MTDPFPVEDFDGWAESYDYTVANTVDFPFTGYAAVLDKVIELAKPQPNMRVLDLGTGTGNLALRFDAFGSKIWGTDFSPAMLTKARAKLPKAQFYQADLRGDWPSALNHRFERIVSAYVFHHFELEEKVQIIESLVQQHLEPTGRLIIADIAFPNQPTLETIKRAAGDEWEDEYYWLVDQDIPALQNVGLKARFHGVSSCTGVFEIV